MRNEAAAPKGGHQAHHDHTPTARQPLAALEAALGGIGPHVRYGVELVDDACSTLIDRPSPQAVAEWADVLDRVSQAVRMWMAADASLNGSGHDR